MELPAEVAVDPKVCHGKPVIRGTRIMVADVLMLLAGGKNPDEIRRDYYSALTDGQIRACIEYAARVVRDEEVHAA